MSYGLIEKAITSISHTTRNKISGIFRQRSIGAITFINHLYLVKLVSISLKLSKDKNKNY